MCATGAHTCEPFSSAITAMLRKLSQLIMPDRPTWTDGSAGARTAISRSSWNRFPSRKHASISKLFLPTAASIESWSVVPHTLPNAPAVPGKYGKNRRPGLAGIYGREPEGYCLLPVGPDCLRSRTAKARGDPSRPRFRYTPLTFTRLECKFVGPLACLRIVLEGLRGGLEAPPPTIQHETGLFAAQPCVR
jgi:hypothetical protein